MKLLTNNLSWFQRGTHGYFVAKPFFKGEFKREVFITIYDTLLDKSSYGYIFICEKNVVLSVIKNLTDKRGIYELESTDDLSIIDNAENFLLKALNKTSGSEKSLSVSTTNPIASINLNKKYLIFCSIQADRNYGFVVKGSLKTIFLTSKEEPLKVSNLLQLIRNIINGNEVNFDTKLVGVKANLAIFNIYCVAIGVVPVVLFFTAAIIGTIIYMIRNILNY